MARLKNEIRQIERGELNENARKKQRQIKQLEKDAPHQLNGKMIIQKLRNRANPMICTVLKLIVSFKSDLDRINSVDPSDPVLKMKTQSGYALILVIYLSIASAN